MFENKDKRKFSLSEEEEQKIRDEGKREGLSDTEIDAKIIALRGKMEAATARANAEWQDKEHERSVGDAVKAIEERYKNDPEFRERMDALNKEEEKEAA